MEDKSKYVESGINSKTLEVLFYDKNLPIPLEDTKTSDKIFKVLEKFTRIRNDNFYDRILKKLYQRIHHITYDEETNRYIYNCNEEQIEFEKISDRIDDKELKEELETEKGRKGQCHKLSFKYLNILKNPTQILTGLYAKNGKNHLHSVVEMQTESGMKICDFTINAIMEKEQYIRLRQFIEIERLTDLEQLEDRKNGVDDFLFKTQFMDKPYLSFKEEIKRDLDKNKSALKQTNNKKVDELIEKVKEEREKYERE